MKHISMFFAFLLIVVALQAKTVHGTVLSPEYSLSLAANPDEGGTVSGAGNYPANALVEVSANAAAGYNFLFWSDESGEVISTQASFVFTMPEQDVELTANFACTPGWSFETNYQFSMQFIIQISFDDVISLNPNDMVGAFVGDECRGIGYPMPEFDGLTFLTVGSNAISGETIELRLWNSTICDSCSTIQLFGFENNALIGTLDNPLQLSCSNETALQIDFTTGYTWFSLNIDQFYMQPDTLFKNLEPCYNDRIIGQHSFTVYNGTNWVGNLHAISPEKMYRMRLCEAQSYEITSNQAPNTTLDLPAGSTWLGYRPTQCLSPNEALQNLTPAPAYNDRILGQNAFALYNGSQWIGSLTQMCPGKGYIIKLSSESELTYPSEFGKQSVFLGTTKEILRNPEPAYVNNKQHNMMLVGELQTTDAGYSFHPEDKVYAIIDGEIAGVASPVSESNGLLFMTIGENTLEAKNIRFKIWRSETQSFFAIHEQIHFENLAERGSLDKPFKLTFQTTDQNTDVGRWYIGEPYPNPANDIAVIDLLVHEDVLATIQVYDHFGRLLSTYETMVNGQGKQQLAVQVKDLLPGIYTVNTRLTGDKRTEQSVSQLLVR